MMTSQTRFILRLLACGLCSASLDAAPIIDLLSPGATVNPGDSFQVSLTLTNDLPALDIIGCDFFVSSSANGTFSLSARNYASPLTALATSNASLTLPRPVTTTGIYQNDGSTLANLGASDPTETGFGLGTTTIVTLTFTLSPSAAIGSAPTLTFYNTGPTFNPGGPAFSDNDIFPNEYQGSSPLVFTLNVVPEPATAALLILGALFMVPRRRTREPGIQR